MKIKFFKYHGAGNDFIMIDAIKQNLTTIAVNTIRDLCHRRFGIGADGLILLKKTDKADFEMDYYNSDGSGATMCGNGGRCSVAFADFLNLINHKTTFLASDGLHDAEILTNNSVRLKMQDVTSIEKKSEHYFLYTGSPHVVKFLTELTNFPVFREGRKIRNSNIFGKEGTNVNFVEQQGNKLYVRTYERGVEDETLACGTGVVASAISAFFETGQKHKSFQIKVQGGNLQVDFEFSGGIFQNVWLEGPAQKVFEGQIDI